MPTARVNEAALFYELTEAQAQIAEPSEPVVLVHGSWVDHHVWDAVVPHLAKSLTVLSFDRRGHGRSDRTPRQGSMAGAAEDLAALIEALDLAPAHIAGVSWGGSIVLRLASKRPELFLSMIVHEPPLFTLVADDAECRGALRELESVLGAVVKQLSTGDAEGGARRYVEEVAYEPGAWAKLTEGVRRTYLESAQAYLDQCLSPDQWSVDLAALSDFPHPVLLTQGDQRAAVFGHILDLVAASLPEPERKTLPGTAHAPQLTHPAGWAGATLAFTAKAKRPAVVGLLGQGLD